MNSLPAMDSASRQPYRSGSSTSIGSGIGIGIGSGSQVSRGGAILPPRVAFVPGAPHSDLFGVVNCPPPTTPSSYSSSSSNEGATSAASVVAAATSSSSSSTQRLKHGPALLEIRRIEYRSPIHRGGEWSSTSTPLYHRETTVLVSRGIPGLGTSVSSTCLDFRPHHFGGVSSSSSSAAAAAAEASTAVRCATGLTSGALCVHSLYNLYGKYNNDDDGGGRRHPGCEHRHVPA